MLLTERGLAESRQKAQAMILAGQVFVAGQKQSKAGSAVSSAARVEVAGEKVRYASRGGLKLEGALEDFGVNARGKTCLDIGSSTGGFTDCLLQHGAARVVAVDVSPAQLAWKLRQDPRVVAVKQNARNLSREDFAERSELITVDVSFISVAKIIPPAAAMAEPGADLLILIKPQFELSRGEVGKGGIVRESRLHQQAIERATAAAESAGLRVRGVRPSRVTGAGGNQEYFLHAQK